MAKFRITDSPGAIDPPLNVIQSASLLSNPTEEKPGEFGSTTNCWGPREICPKLSPSLFVEGKSSTVRSSM